MRFFQNCTRINDDVGHFVTVDETLVGYRGRCGIRVYMPSKPAKYGIRVYNSVDAETMYMFNAIPIVENQ